MITIEEMKSEVKELISILVWDDLQEKGFEYRKDYYKDSELRQYYSEATRMLYDLFRGEYNLPESIFSDYHPKKKSMMKILEEKGLFESFYNYCKVSAEGLI